MAYVAGTYIRPRNHNQRDLMFGSSNQGLGRQINNKSRVRFADRNGETVWKIPDMQPLSEDEAWGNYVGSGTHN